MQIVYPAVAGPPGLPATIFPAGRSADGLPFGLKPVGPAMEDRTPIRFAGLLSSEIGDFAPPPGYSQQPGTALSSSTHNIPESRLRLRWTDSDLRG